MSRTALVALVALVLLPSTSVAAEECTAAQRSRILAPAEAGDTTAVVDCDLTLSPLMASTITRRLVFRGAASSGVTLDCQGGVIDGRHANDLEGTESPTVSTPTILITSRRIGSSSIPGVGIWEPVTDVTIRDCEVIGSIRIRGLAANGNDHENQHSSHVPLGHVARVRAAAPRRITLDGITLVGNGSVPLYVAVGVQDTTITGAYVTGSSIAVAIYLDAESTRTTIRDTTIDTRTPRELIAIDGSPENLIVANRFSSLSHGGIYLFRNCGEKSAVRFSTPSYNQILNNVFYYDRYTGSAPAVYFGADNGPSTHRFCGADAAYPYGSGADDRDFASENVVMQNQFYGRNPEPLIRADWPETNTPNHVAANTLVTRATSQPTGCFVPDGFPSSFLAHGATTELFRDDRGLPHPSGVAVTCLDGELHYAPAPRGRIEQVPFSCAASGDSDGCTGSMLCPGASTLVGAHAACNLEFGRVTDAQLRETRGGVIRVARASDLPWEGSCRVGERDTTVGELALESAPGAEATFGCRERDRNGGDCEIRGLAYCYHR